MTFSSWADYLAGHNGSEESSTGISELARRFEYGSSPLSHLKGEEAIVFLGISADGSPLLVHHLTDIGSTRKDPLPDLVALAGLRQSTSVVRLSMEDCFATIPSGMDDTDEEYYLPSFSKLVDTSSPGAFAEVSLSQTKMILALECLCLIPLPPFLIPCIASHHAHSGFAELGKACTNDIVACELACDDGGPDEGKRPLPTYCAVHVVGPPSLGSGRMNTGSG
jgi:hypothetical protein